MTRMPTLGGDEATRFGCQGPPGTKAMHSRKFETVLGKIGFDEKGDVRGFEAWQWFVWQAVPFRHQDTIVRSVARGMARDRAPRQPV